MCTPSQSLTWSNSSHGPTAVRFAISGLAPAFSAVTYLLLACARRLITEPVPEEPPNPSRAVDLGSISDLN
jgi:hypothetical protein